MGIKFLFIKIILFIDDKSIKTITYNKIIKEFEKLKLIKKSLDK